jgi:signal transduction histidine kinase
MRYSLDKKILFGFTIAILILFVVAFFTFHNSEKVIESDKWVEHTQKVEYQLQQILVSTVDAETGVRGYVIVGTDAYLEPFERALKNMPEFMDSLRALTSDNPTQQKNLDTLDQLITKSILYLKGCIALRTPTTIDSEVECIKSGEGKGIEDGIRKVIANSKRVEDTLLLHRKIASREETDGFHFVFFMLITIIIIILLVMYIIINKNIKTIKIADERIRQLNFDLQANNAQLEMANSELESYSYSISHDLKTPLRAMVSFSELLEERYAHLLDENGKIFLNTISENGQTLSTMVDKLLEFSRLGRQDIKKTDVDMNSLVEKCVDELKYTLKHHAKINIQPLEHIEGDPVLLSIVWNNLISNAVKYSGKIADPLIDIGCIVKKNEVVYYVKDNGAGFNMEYAHKLFGVFKRLHTQSEFEGIGVGLAIVQRIIIKHGGKIWVESEVSKGATFYFSLPTSK